MSQRPGLVHDLTFLEWITGPRCPRQCLSGTSPLWKVFHEFFGGGINSAKGTEIILYCSVSPYSLSRAGLDNVREQTLHRSVESHCRTY